MKKIATILILSTILVVLYPMYKIGTTVPIDLEERAAELE